MLASLRANSFPSQARAAGDQGCSPRPSRATVGRRSWRLRRLRRSLIPAPAGATSALWRTRLGALTAGSGAVEPLAWGCRDHLLEYQRRHACGSVIMPGSSSPGNPDGSRMTSLVSGNAAVPGPTTGMGEVSTIHFSQHLASMGGRTRSTLSPFPGRHRGDPKYPRPFAPRDADVC